MAATVGQSRKCRIKIAQLRQKFETLEGAKVLRKIDGTAILLPNVPLQRRSFLCGYEFFQDIAILYRQQDVVVLEIYLSLGKILEAG
jgi:hypothetical protein